MNSSPYSSFRPAAFWRQGVAELPAAEIDPVLDPAPFKIDAATRVMTAGSCFAQHIARYLRESGFNVLLTEPAHPIASPETAQAFNYGIFTARYGNLYTARQLLQLFDRAYGDFHPLEDIWEESSGLIDPFRPRIQPGGFPTRAEYDADRQQHFAAVRRAFEQLDVFVFTLGLTESWRSRLDGAVFPLCPGVAGGRFDEAAHEFHNFTAAEIVDDLLGFAQRLRGVNAGARILLTVSPVPLVATAEPRHVLVSTAYSKAALRVACEEVCRARECFSYFPSYEIVTGSFSRGAYYGADCRSVTEEGVQHVMRVFFRHFTTGGALPGAAPESVRRDAHIEKMEDVVAAICDEELLDVEQSA